MNGAIGERQLIAGTLSRDESKSLVRLKYWMALGEENEIVIDGPKYIVNEDWSSGGWERETARQTKMLN